jgi:acyl-CoA synthetase (AMP-forming)/AMP-acid ligase II
MCADVQPKLVKSASLMRRGIIFVTLLIAVFLLGFVPMWLKSRECSRNLSEAEHQLNLARIQNSLASAVIDARRGDYESARQAASDFFTSLRTVTEKVDDSALSMAQREEVQSLLTQRDGIITLLARGDLASADRLSDLYVSYREIMNSMNR